MVHCGYEGTAVEDTVKHPLKALKVALKGVETEGPMAPEIPLDGHRSAEYTFDDFVVQATSQSGDEDRPAEAGASSRAAE